MSEKKKLNRRSFMARIAGGAVIAGGATALITGKAEAQNYTGRTDNDSGSGADQAGYGRTGLTDNDSGNGSDRGGYGRGGGGGGNNRTGLTDSDSGGNADNAGNGRGATRNRQTGLTDGDSGGAADAGGYGRGPRRNWSARFMAHEPWLVDPLAYLIGAGREDDFFARIYEREALITHHNAPARFAGLISLDDIDRIVTTLDLREGQLALADASAEIDSSSYVDGGSFIDRGAVADRYRRGATIVLNQAHQFDPALARLCRGLEHVFSSHVQTNIYLTPANAQGFRTHYDNHDVLVIQVEGEKAWRLYDMPIEAPYRGEGFQPGRYEPGPLRQEFVLKPGDCAYVPRGMMHDAQASGDAPSLHITVGLITRTWADLMLEAVSEAALRSPELRRSLPPGFARNGFDRVKAGAHLKGLVHAVADDMQIDPALDLLVDTFIRSRGANNRSALRDAGSIGAQDRFQVQPRAPFRIAEDGDDIVVVCPGGELKFSPDQRPALELALGGGVFALGDLKVEKADAMASTLLAYGLIARA